MPKPKRDVPSHRVFEPGKRHMELIASVSRSSGLEKDGDALRNFKLQEKYREFIQEKLDDYWRRYPHGRPVKDTKQRDEVQGNLLILFRKLREGILSTKRNDAFALEVYETSLHLSLLFASPKQTASILPYLLPGLYSARTPLSPSSLSTTVLSLMHSLVSSYPSQSAFFESLHSLPNRFLPPQSNARRWLLDLARTVRLRNYAKMEQLTMREAFNQILPGGETSSETKHSKLGSSRKDHPPLPPDNMAMETLCVLVNALRSKVQETTWRIMRSAYRELYCSQPTDAASSFTRDWLCRSLTLRPNTKAGGVAVDDLSLLDAWLEKKHVGGEIRLKEGAQGRWIVCKLT